MAWSYTKASSTIHQSDSGYWANWTNAWTVEEATPTQSGYIRLKVTVTTSAFNANNYSYVWYSADSMSYGGSTISIHARSQVPGDATYTAYVQVPQSWSNKTVSFTIAWTTVSTTLGATGVSKSTVSASNGIFGQGIPITMTNPVSGVKHTVTVACGGNAETLLSNSSAMSVTWTPSLATYGALITNAASATATISCTTYYGGTSMGSDTKSITVSFAASDVAPTVATGWASIAARNESPATGFTVWIQGYSKARATFDSSKITLKHSATIAKYSITCNGSTTDVTPPSTTGDTAVIPNTSVSIVCTVTDSRGFTASETFDITLLAYATPSVSDASVFRCDIDGDADEDGYYIAVKATAIYSSLGNENTYTMKAFVRELDQQYSGNGTTLTSGTKEVLSLYSPDVSYEVKIELTDGLGNTATFLKTLPSRAWAMKFRETGDGVAFGKAPATGSANAKLLEIGPGWALRIWSSDGTTYEDLDYTALHGLLQ